MDLSHSEETNELRRAAADFAKHRVAPNIREKDEHAQVDVGLYREMGKEGFLGCCIPQKYGGLGLDYHSLAVASEEFEYVDTSARVVVSVHVGLNSLTLLQWANESQKQRYLVPQAKGEKLATFGLTEPAAGSDVVGLQCTAIKRGDRYVLNGEKTWISLANVADQFLVFAYTDLKGREERRHERISAFIVERGWKGLATSSLHGKLGVRAGDTGSISFQDVEVPEENRLGEEGEGFKIAMSALDGGRFTVAAGCVGLIRACLDASVQYANQRTVANVPIGRMQLVQQMIANMVASRDIGDLLVRRVGWMKNQGLRCTREVALAKWVNTVNSLKCAEDAIEVHGAYGFSNEFPVERYWRNARGAVIYEGSREIQNLIQAEYALGYRKDKPLRCPPPPWPSE